MAALLFCFSDASGSRHSRSAKSNLRRSALSQYLRPFAVDCPPLPIDRNLVNGISRFGRDVAVLYVLQYPAGVSLRRGKKAASPGMLHPEAVAGRKHGFLLVVNRFGIHAQLRRLSGLPAEHALGRVGA